MTRRNGPTSGRERSTDSADAYFGLGLVAAASGERRRKWEALTRFREAIRRDWNHAGARYHLAQTLYDLGEPGAEFELQDLVRVNKTYKIAYLTLSRWEEPKPDGLKEALRWCERGLKALPDDPDLLTRRVELRVAAGDYDRAVEELRSLLKGKFVKGKLRVIPAPSRAFEVDQSVFVYFEVYSLKPDAQGRTRYRVDYTVRSRKGVGDLVLAGLGQLIGRSQKGDEVTVSYESGGEATQEAIHTALDLRKGKEGDYTLRVTVTDLNAGAKAARETTFRVQK